MLQGTWCNLLVLILPSLQTTTPISAAKAKPAIFHIFFPLAKAVKFIPFSSSLAPPSFQASKLPLSHSCSFFVFSLALILLEVVPLEAVCLEATPLSTISLTFATLSAQNSQLHHVVFQREYAHSAGRGQGCQYRCLHSRHGQRDR